LSVILLVDFYFILIYDIKNRSQVTIVSFGGSFSNTFLEIHHLPASPVSFSPMYQTLCLLVQPRISNSTLMSVSHASATLGPSIPSNDRKLWLESHGVNNLEVRLGCWVGAHVLLLRRIAWRCQPWIVSRLYRIVELDSFHYHLNGDVCLGSYDGNNAASFCVTIFC
jgi:hypothetical protein